jgi:hypothetical protein
MFAVSWQEKDGATVANIQDDDCGLVHSFVTMPMRSAGSLLKILPT